MNSTLVLVDGSSFLYRAFHAMPPLTNETGHPTGALYGVINMLKKLRVDYPVKYFAVVFDAKGKNFRHILAPDYKANRAQMPDDLRLQIEPLHEIIQALGFTLISKDEVEADDVIGSLALQAAKLGFKVIIASGDKDFTQIVGPNITLFNAMSDQVLDVAGVEKKFFVKPHQMIDYLSLVGDSADNIKGVEKVGPKTAAKWLQDYGSIENLIKNQDELKGKVAENFKQSHISLALAQKLISLKLDVMPEFDFESLVPKPVNIEQCKAFYQRFGFKSWLQILEGENHSKFSEPIKPNRLVDYKIILNAQEFYAFKSDLLNADWVAFDTETTGFNLINSEIVGLSFAFKPGTGFYIPLAHQYLGAPPQLDRNWVLETLKPWFENKNSKKIAHHLKFDLHMLANHGIEVKGIMFDTLLESYILNSTQSRRNLEFLAKNHLNIDTISFEQLAGKGVKQKTFDQLPIEEAGFYAAEDADVTLSLHQHLWPQLIQHQGLKFIFEQIDLPLVPVLLKMERAGVKIDPELLKIQSLEIGERLKKIEDEAYQLAGESFNLNSPKQLKEILFERLGLPIVDKTPSGQASTAEASLQKLAIEYPLPKIILNYRSLAKLKSTYTDSLGLQINTKTGRIHTSYQQAVTSTGRLSSTDPNLQNIPIKTPEGRRIRAAFIAAKDQLLMSADYSQIELRIMAHLSKDATLLKVFANNADVHQQTAADIFGVKINDVTPTLRRQAKSINFGLIYGMSAFGLAKQLNINRQEAELYIQAYFETFEGVKAYMDAAKEKITQQGFVETLWGRRIYFPDIRSKSALLRKAAERGAINAPLQGSQADIIKLAMIDISKALQSEGFKAKMIMQVHDELIFELPYSERETLQSLVETKMLNAAKLDVPIPVNIAFGKNWDEAH